MQQVFVKESKQTNKQINKRKITGKKRTLYIFISRELDKKIMHKKKKNELPVMLSARSTFLYFRNFDKPLPSQKKKNK